MKSNLKLIITEKIPTDVIDRYKKESNIVINDITNCVKKRVESNFYYDIHPSSLYNNIKDFEGFLFYSSDLGEVRLFHHTDRNIYDYTTLLQAIVDKSIPIRISVTDFCTMYSELFHDTVYVLNEDSSDSFIFNKNFQANCQECITEEKVKKIIPEFSLDNLLELLDSYPEHIFSAHEVFNALKLLHTNVMKSEKTPELVIKSFLNSPEFKAYYQQIYYQYRKVEFTIEELNKIYSD